MTNLTSKSLATSQVFPLNCIHRSIEVSLHFYCDVADEHANQSAEHYISIVAHEDKHDQKAPERFEVESKEHEEASEPAEASEVASMVHGDDGTSAPSGALDSEEAEDMEHDAHDESDDTVGEELAVLVSLGNPS